MEHFFSEVIAARFNFWAFIVLMMIGLYAMIGKNNLVKKVIGMNIFQTAIILFYVSTAVKEGATLPILSHDAAHGGHGEAPAAQGGHYIPDADTAYSAAESAGHAAAGAAHATGHAVVQAIDYINPLPHVLMLTAIVVSVATLGVALALLLKIYRDHKTLDEDAILESLRHD